MTAASPNTNPAILCKLLSCFFLGAMGADGVTTDCRRDVDRLCGARRRFATLLFGALRRARLPLFFAILFVRVVLFKKVSVLESNTFNGCA
jgi:hypothetical protein